MSRRQVRQAEIVRNPAPGSRSCQAVTIGPAARARQDESMEDTWWSEVTAEVTVTGRRDGVASAGVMWRTPLPGLLAFPARLGTVPGPSGGRWLNAPAV